jgi:hypothetical protein
LKLYEVTVERVFFITVSVKGSKVIGFTGTIVPVVRDPGYLILGIAIEHVSCGNLPVFNHSIEGVPDQEAVGIGKKLFPVLPHDTVLLPGIDNMGNP